MNLCQGAFYKLILVSLVFAFSTSVYEANAQLSITCPGDITQDNDPGNCSAIVNFTPPVGTGSGTGITTTLTSGLPPGSDFSVGVTEIVYTVTNNEGDVETCNFFVTVEDDEDPAFTCPGDIMVNADPNTCEAVVFFVTPMATDNCGISSVIQIGGPPTGSSFSVGETNLDFQATDFEGNLAFCRVKVIVTDITDPEITCPADIVVDASASCQAVVNYTPPVGVDACSVANTVLSGGLGSGSSFPLGTTVEEYTVTDLEGNTASCSFSITVVDVTPPTITCPADVSVNAASGDCEAVVNFADPTFGDNCPGVTLNQTGGLSSGSNFPAGVSTIEFTATDGAGLTTVCSFTVTVIEDEDPEIICPGDITVSTDPGDCTALVNYTPPVGTDNCSGANTVLSSGLGSGAIFPIGTTTETYVVTDASGNTASCSFDVVVEDDEDPEITCPADITIDNDFGLCSAIVVFADPSGSDNCPGVTVTQTDGIASGGNFPVGTSVVEYTAEDAAGNTTVCTFSVTVNDVEAPSINCPADQSLAIPGGLCSGVVTYPDPVFSDNCPGSSFSVLSGPESGDIVSVGDYVIDLQVTDLAGNTESCSFNLTVTETSDPVFTCPADLTISNDAGSCDAIVNFPDPIATDSCSAVSVSQTLGPASGSTFPIGSTPVEFLAEDPFGNTATCAFNIIVEDDEAPSITCPSDISTPADPSTCGAVVNFSPPLANDNCPGVTVNQTSGPLSGSSFPIGTTTIEFTAEDASGNTTICTFDIVVSDDEAPVITCPADIMFAIPGGNCSAPINYPDPTVTDNCPGEGFNVISGPLSGATLNAGVYTVELEAFDAAGNTSTCSFLITVSETSVPVFTCPADLIVGTDAGDCSAIVNFPSPTATDSCSTVNITQTTGPLSGSTFMVGTTFVEFTAEDPFGNSATCGFNIIVEDQESPIIDCPSDLIFPVDAGTCAATVVFSAPSVSDNCPGVVLTQTDGPSSGTLFPVGSTQIEFTAEDASGNTTICQFNIIVEDDEDPTISCPAPITTVIPNGFCEGGIAYPDPVIADNCPGVTFNVVSGPASGDIVPAGVYTVELEATDAAGNTASCSFILTVEETSVPVFNCPSDLVVSADPGSCEAVVNFPAPMASDSCSAVTVTQISGPVSGSTFPAGATTVEFEAEDGFGNTASCSFDILVVDDTDPTIDCPDDIEVNNELGLCGATVIYPAPTANDNCGVLSITQTAGLGSGSFFPVGETIETYQVEDVSGNMSTCSFSVTVIDAEDPAITCPADINLVLADGDCDAVINYLDPTATDNCTGVTINLVSGPASGSLVEVGITEVVYEAIDDAGNSSTCSFNITITENVDPEIICPMDITVDSEPGVCGATVTYVPPIGTDGCNGASTTLTAGLGPDSFFPVGSTTETYTVTDASGNSASCSFQIIVVDAELPIIDCPTDIEVNVDPSTCGAIVNFPNPDVTDNCTIGLLSIQTAGPPSGSTFDVGSTAIEFEATDDAGNTAICAFNVIVTDDEFPTIDCPASFTLNAPSGDCSTIGNYPDPSFEDNCPGAFITLIDGIASGNEFPVGVNEIIYEVEDASGNTAQCSFTVTVLEDVLPEIVCPADIEVTNDLGECGALVNYTPPIGTDNCGTPVTELSQGLPPGSVFEVGVTIVSYVVTDESGNQDSCQFTITVGDNEPPQFDCPSDLSFSASAITCGFNYDFTEPTVNDNCTNDLVVTQTAGPISGTLLPLGTTVFTFTTVDEAGNNAECSYEVTIVDDTPPIFTFCPDDISLNTGIDDCLATISFDLPTATDNCDFDLVQTEGPLAGEQLPPGAYPVSYTATDDSGNSVDCSFVITIIDDTAPVIDCPDDFETCDTEPEFETPVATDNCAIASILQIEGPESGTTFPEGETTITFEAIDINGNSTLCSFVITVLENAPRADAGDNQNVCDETSATLFGNNPESLLGTWLLISGAGTIESPGSQTTNVTGLGAGENIFVWSIDPENGCDIETDTTSIFVELDASLDAGPDQSIQSGSGADLLANANPPGGDFVWSPDQNLSCINCANPFADPDETTLYFVEYTTELGCELSDSVLVRVFDELPNTITPDNDGANDVWNIPSIDDYPDVEVVIFNRWGNEVFKSQGYNEPWDGTQNGKELPTGSYFYIIDYKVDGKENLSGTVNIIR